MSWLLLGARRGAVCFTHIFAFVVYLVMVFTSHNMTLQGVYFLSVLYEETKRLSTWQVTEL